MDRLTDEQTELRWLRRATAVAAVARKNVVTTNSTRACKSTGMKKNVKSVAIFYAVVICFTSYIQRSFEFQLKVYFYNASAAAMCPDELCFVVKLTSHCKTDQ